MKKVKSLLVAIILFVTSSIAVFTIAGCSGGSTPGTNNDPAQNLTFTLLEDDTYSVKTTNKKIEGALVIPSTHEGKDVTEIEQKGFSSCQSLTSVTIPESVTKIGDEAFQYCQKLENVSFGNVNLRNNPRSIETRAFQYCIKISEITLPMLVHIKSYAFANCGEITFKYPGTKELYEQIARAEMSWSQDTVRTLIYLGESSN